MQSEETEANRYLMRALTRLAVGFGKPTLALRVEVTAILPIRGASKLLHVSFSRLTELRRRTVVDSQIALSHM